MLMRVILHEEGHWYPWAMLYGDCKMGLGAEDECRDDKVAQIGQATVHDYFHPESAHHIETKPNA